jgi:hypothetical protein
MAKPEHLGRLHHATTTEQTATPANAPIASQQRPEQRAVRSRFASPVTERADLDKPGGHRQVRNPDTDSYQGLPAEGSYVLDPSLVLRPRLQNVDPATASCGCDRGNFGSPLTGSGHR